MPSWATMTLETLWGNALTVIPLAIIVAVAARFLPCRPWTRHTLWLLVIGWLILPPLLPRAPLGTARSMLGEAASQTKVWMAGTSLFNHERKPSTPPKIDGPTPAPTPSSAIALGSGADSSDPASDAVAILTHPEPRLSIPEPSESAPSESIRKSARIRSAKPRAIERGPSEFVEEARNEAGVSSAETRVTETLIPPARSPRLAPEATVDSTITLPATTVPEVAPVVAPTDAATPRRPVQQWLAGLVAIRDAVLALSPVPASVWVGGIILVVAIRCLGAVMFLERLRSAAPASASTLAMVKQAAAALGLREAPEVAMLRGRASPMVWCPPTPSRSQLLLPSGLWRQLDDLGRRAVIFHELAHLRRRDHWVSWLQMLVASLFWWHPVSWWAGRRLREEADFCCDAWVTWLFPRGRRAYAEALLRARIHTSDSVVPVPALGMGVNLPRSDSFARRITMVMTESNRPRISVSGAALIAAIAFAAWLAVPAQSCPSKDKDGSPNIAKALSPGHSHAHGGCATTPVPPEPAEAPEPAETPEPPMPPEPADENTFEHHMRRHPAPPAALAPLGTIYSLGAAPALAPLMAIGNPGDDDDEDDEDLEKRLERLERELQRLSERLEGMGSLPRTPRPDAPGRPASPPRAPAMPRSPVGAPSPAGEIISKPYQLDKGKLELLNKLMSRQDVPILVQPGEAEIVVQATASQHDAFQAFVNMIEGKKEEVETRGYALPKGKLEDMTALMVRDDVPVHVEPSESELRVRGTPSQHAVFQDFITLLDGGEPRAPRAARARTRNWQGADSFPGAQWSQNVDAYRKAHEELAQAMRQSGAHRKVMGKAIRENIKARLSEIKAQAKTLEQQAKQLDKQAERLEEQAEKLRKKADEMREKADSSEPDGESDQMRAEADAVNGEADRMQVEADHVRAQVAMLESQAEAMDSEAESMEAEADDEMAALEAEAAEAEAAAAEAVTAPTEETSGAR